MKPMLLSLLAFVALVLATPASAGEDDRIGTLTLDPLSLLSFEGIESLAIPSGSTIRFRFGNVQGGSAAFTIQPIDVSVAPIALSVGGGELAYTLAAPASGTIRKGADGFVVSFTATIRATRTGAGDVASQEHTLTFTTEHAQATGALSRQTVAVDGMQVVPGPDYVQIVGAVGNPKEMELHPGRAVYTVLSGSFDWVPDLED